MQFLSIALLQPETANLLSKPCRQAQEHYSQKQISSRVYLGYRKRLILKSLLLNLSISNLALSYTLCDSASYTATTFSAEIFSESTEIVVVVPIFESPVKINYPSFGIPEKMLRNLYTKFFAQNIRFYILNNF